MGSSNLRSVAKMADKPKVKTKAKSLLTRRKVAFISEMWENGHNSAIISQVLEIPFEDVRRVTRHLPSNNLARKLANDELAKIIETQRDEYRQEHGLEEKNGRGVSGDYEQQRRAAVAKRILGLKRRYGLISESNFSMYLNALGGS